MQNTDDILQENIALKKIISEKNHRIQHLDDFIRSLNQKQFGSSSEKLEAIQADLFVDAEEDEDVSVNAEVESPETITVTTHQRKKHRESIPAHLTRVEIIHDLPEDFITNV
jgi:transposase